MLSKHIMAKGVKSITTNPSLPLPRTKPPFMDTTYFHVLSHLVRRGFGGEVSSKGA